MTDEMEWEERCVVYRRAKLALDRAPAASGEDGYVPGGERPSADESRPL
ncbi:hypothetical protein [Nonomuraea endophytica]